jgi:alcohol dehydrogenase class IV
MSRFAFEFFNLPRIIFGAGTSARVAELARALGNRALVIHSGPAPSFVTGTYVRQRGEPTVADVDAALELARQHGCDVLVAVGGGSAIDTAKAVAGLVTNAGSALDYTEVVGRGKKIDRPALPWVAIPTTAGTGAEVTRNAVVGSTEHKFKASIRSELLLPRLVVIDPELATGVPRHVTAASGMDALCQCVESYVSKNASPVTDALARRGVELAHGTLQRACERGGDIDARAAMAACALFSGITLTNAGLGAVHGFAAPLGANFPVPHGVVCAALLPGVIRANLEESRRQGRTDVVGKYHSLGELEWVAALAREIGIPPLSQFGVRPGDVDAVVQLAKQASSMKYNPVVLPDEVLRDVLLEAIG